MVRVNPRGYLLNYGGLFFMPKLSKNVYKYKYNADVCKDFGAMFTRSLKKLIKPEFNQVIKI